MNAAAAEDENNAERETGAPAPALVLVRTRKESCAAGSPSRAGNASRNNDVLERLSNDFFHDSVKLNPLSHL